jgi:hypothetical protein
MTLGGQKPRALRRQVLSVDVLHRQKELTSDLADVIHAADVGV